MTDKMRAIAEADKKARLEAWVNYEPGTFDDSQINMGAHLRHAFMSGWEARPLDRLAALEAERAVGDARVMELRDLVAKLYCASGCSCCRDDKAWEGASDQLAVAFGVPRFSDLSGYDWYSVDDAALAKQEPNDEQLYLDWLAGAEPALNAEQVVRFQARLAKREPGS